jgi:phospholipid transport system substrate-binding protein
MKRDPVITPVRLILLMAALLLVGVALWSGLKPVVPAPPSPPPAGSSPMADLEKSNAALKLCAKSIHSWSPEYDAERAEMYKIVRNLFDFEELARRALARHWENMNSKQRTEFVRVLGDLIERHLSKQIHSQPNYDLRFTKETITGSEASVETTLDTLYEGRKITLAMEYKLLYTGDRWLGFDVVTDEQSMMENYRAEFDKIITKESFDTLIRRMKKRLEKAE